MVIDAHQHFWRYDPTRDSWITEDMKKIQRDFMPDDLKPLLDKNKISGCVAIQADQSETETDFLLGLADDNDWINGVVGWIDLLAEDADQRLDYFANRPKFKGVRHILQAEPKGFMSRPKFIKGVELLAKKELTYDILTTEMQLNEVLILIEKLPEMKLVIDHISKPDIRNRSFNYWAKAMKKVSSYSHVHIKLSGMVTEADWHDWSTIDIKPYIDFCLENFPVERLMFGSDWPVSLLAGSYDKVVKSLKECIQKLSPSDQDQIMGKTACKFYNLN